MKLYLPVFHGIAPRRAPRKLEQSQAQTARNCELFSEELRPLKDSIEVDTPTKTGTIQSIYLLVDKWLHWTTDVDVSRSPLYLENENRIYYTGDYSPKSTNYAMAQSGTSTDYPTAYWRLGLPRADTAPTVNHTAGSGNDIERSYVYTYVTAWGEEGPPSPVGTHVGKSDATSWNISGMDNVPPNSGGILAMNIHPTYVELVMDDSHFLETSEYITVSGPMGATAPLNGDIQGTWKCTRVAVDRVRVPVITNGVYTSGATWAREAPLNVSSMTKRLYRTFGGNYRFVAGSITGTTYSDTVDDEDLGELLPGGLSETDWWKAPPGDLQGLQSFPGGMLCGFFGNTLAFCEPNVPSAWPEAYQFTFNFDIVSIGVVGNTVVVTTKGFPSVVTGDHPSAMVQSELEVFQSCVSKRGTVSLFNGVMYPSPDGMVYVPSVGVPTIATEQFFKKKDWQDLNPSSFISTLHDDRYYGFYSDAGENFNNKGAIIFDPKEMGATFSKLGTNSTAVYSDIETDNMYIMVGNNIHQYDSGGRYKTFVWLSKLFTTAYPVCFKAAKVKITLGEGITDTERNEAVQASVDALDIELEETALSTTFGDANNYVSGAIAGYPVAEYAYAGGPYYNVIAGIGDEITAQMEVYAHFDNGSGRIERHLVHTQDLLGSKPFRMPGGYESDQWEIKLSGNNVIVHECLLASNMQELGEV